MFVVAHSCSVSLHKFMQACMRSNKKIFSEMIMNSVESSSWSLSGTFGNWLAPWIQAEIRKIWLLAVFIMIYLGVYCQSWWLIHVTGQKALSTLIFLFLLECVGRKVFTKFLTLTHTLEDPNTKLKRNYVPSLFFASIFFAITTLTCTTLERSLHVPIIQRLRLAWRQVLVLPALNVGGR